MLKVLGVGAASVAAFFVVFVVVFYVSFPGDAVAERVRWQVQDASKGKYNLDLASTSPALFGLGGDAPKLSQTVGKTSKVVLAVDEASVTTGPLQLLWLLIGQDAVISANLARGEGDIDVDVVLGRGEDGVVPRGARVEGALPLGVLPSMGGFSLVGTGEVLIEADLSWVDGPGQANGRIAITGQDLVIEGLASEDGSLDGLLANFEGLPAPVRVLEIVLDVEDGKATVKTGRLESDLVEIDITGDLTLNDDLARSRVKLSLVGRLGEALEAWPGAGLIKGSQSAALWKDGAYHYTWSGVVDRLGAPRPDRERASRVPPKEPAAGGVTPPSRSAPTATRAPKGRSVPASERLDPKSALRGRDAQDDLPELDEVEPEVEDELELIEEVEGPEADFAIPPDEGEEFSGEE
jgi:type II secretion system protein N